jgi:hypothetical protein
MYKCLVPDLTEEKIQQWRDRVAAPIQKANDEARRLYLEGKAEREADESPETSRLIASLSKHIDAHNAVVQRGWDELRSELLGMLSETLDGHVTDPGVAAESVLPMAVWLLYEAHQGEEWADRLASVLAPAEVLGDRQRYARWVTAWTHHYQMTHPDEYARTQQLRESHPEFFRLPTEKE